MEGNKESFFLRTLQNLVSISSEKLVRWPDRVFEFEALKNPKIDRFALRCR